MIKCPLGLIIERYGRTGKMMNIISDVFKLNVKRTQHTNDENINMRILAALGIIFVVAGHLDLQIFNVFGLFPYYSFHVYIFLFISGYFLKERDEKDITGYITRKISNLLVPYFAWNFFYGLMSTALNTQGITIGGTVSPYNLFIAPFLGGHQFMLNFPSWFIPALFVTEIINIFVRKIAFGILRGLKKEYVEILLFAGYTILGIMTVWLAIGGHVWGHYKDIGRIFIMFFGIQFGRIYKLFVEGRLKDSALFNVLSLAVILVIQFLLTRFCGGLAFSTVWVTGFANGPVIPFITVMTGILFWLFVSRLLSLVGEAFPLNRILAYIGRNTFNVMMHHIFVLFIINSIYFMLSKKTDMIRGFDTIMYSTDAVYVYCYAGQFLSRLADLILMVLIPCMPFYLLFHGNKEGSKG